MERVDNYYILLELEFDPPVTDPVQIKSAIHKKKQEWTRAQDNPAKRAVALHLLGMAGEIEKTMLDPVARQEQARVAIGIREDMLRQFEAELRVLEGKGYLSNRDVSAISVKYKPYGVTKDTVKATAKCPVSDTPPNQQMQLSPLGGEVLDRLTAKQIQRNLEVLELPDLYAFLGEVQYASVKKLTDAAQQKRKSGASAGTKGAQSTATQELAGICLGLFADFTSKQRYDQYLKISKYPALNDLIDDEANRSGHLTPSIILRLVNFAVEKYHAKVLDAEEHIRRYCAAYDIPTDGESLRITCPACETSVPRESVVCTACAAPLCGECPGCSAIFTRGPAICADCGFPTGKMVKALRYIDDAQKALIENNWGMAQRNVQYAKKYWLNHAQIEPLEKRARTLEDKYTWYMENISDSVRHNQYYAAQELIREAEARRIRLPAAHVQHVEKVIADFEKHLTLLGDDPPFERVLELAGMVEDSIELSRMMVKHPPIPPTGLQAAEDGRSVRLNWGKSPSPGMIEYILVRKHGGQPLTAFDGDVLYDGSANSFIDHTCKSLAEYYYSLFTKRRGTYSEQGVSAGPVLLIPEIEGLQILPYDQGAQLTWDFNPAMKEVIIWRKLGGDRPTGQGEGIRLESHRIDGFADSRLKNDADYWYFLVAAYLVDGKKLYSRGVCDTVTPRKLVAPIEHLAVVATGNEEDEYVANWHSTQYNDVLLLTSPKPPELRSGDVLPVEELLVRYRKLEPEARQPNSARFRYAFHGGMYIFAAALLGKFATAGQSVYLTKVRAVENPTYDVLDDDLFINMKWPQGVGEVVVAYRYDHFPASLEEVGTNILHITREQYDYDAGVRIKEPERSMYYVHIYSVFVSPDGERFYSEGVRLSINHQKRQDVYYRFKYRHLPLLKQSSVSISISSAEGIVLPGAVFIGKIGRLPLGKTDGVPLFQIDKDTRVKGELTYQYKFRALPKDLFIRMFLSDDAAYDRIRLLPQDNVKIT